MEFGEAGQVKPWEYPAIVISATRQSILDVAK
jgi:hypothetical protein